MQSSNLGFGVVGKNGENPRHWGAIPQTPRMWGTGASPTPPPQGLLENNFFVALNTLMQNFGGQNFRFE